MANLETLQALLTRLEVEVHTACDDLTLLKVEIAVLKTKVVAWGTLAGVVASAVVSKIMDAV